MARNSVAAEPGIASLRQHPRPENCLAQGNLGPDPRFLTVVRAVGNLFHGSTFQHPNRDGDRMSARGLADEADLTSDLCPLVRRQLVFRAPK